MLRPMFHAAVLSAAMLSTPAAAQVAGIDALREWNLVVLGDLQSSSEVGGRTFVGGNLTGNSSNYQVRQTPTSPRGTPGLTVVGDVTGNTKNLNNGAGAAIGGNVASGFNLNGPAQTVKVGGTIANTNVNQNTVQSGLGASDPGFLVGLQQQKSLLTSSMTDLSQTLGRQTANSSLTISGNRGTFDARPDAQGVAVFNITAGDLDRIGEIQFNRSGADTVIVNVAGTEIRLNDNFLGGTQGLGEHVIWNFPEATRVDMTTAWGGAVLAPGAQATTGNQITGSAVFGSLNQNGAMLPAAYAGNYVPPANPGTPGGGEGPTPVPAPPMVLLFGLGAGGLALARYISRRRRSAA